MLLLVEALLATLISTSSACGAVGLLARLRLRLTVIDGRSGRTTAAASGLIGGAMGLELLLIASSRIPLLLRSHLLHAIACIELHLLLLLLLDSACVHIATCILLLVLASAVRRQRLAILTLSIAIAAVVGLADLVIRALRRCHSSSGRYDTRSGSNLRSNDNRVRLRLAGD